MSTKVLAHLITEQELLRHLAIFDRANINGVLIVASLEMSLQLVASVERLLAVNGGARVQLLGLVFEHMSIKLILSLEDLLFRLAWTQGAVGPFALKGPERLCQYQVGGMSRRVRLPSDFDSRMCLRS